jgi:hypothetical protein
MRVLGAFAALVAVAAGLFAAARRLLNRPKRVGVAVIVDPEDHTTVDAEGGVHSVQAADVTLPLDVVEGIWDPHHLERLARTYWRFLTRATLGIVRVKYTETGRYIVVLTKPFTLLSFHAPEYEMDDEVGIVRWRIRKGLLVAQEGREGDGYLEIEVRRCERVDADRVRLHVRVEVANFYPWLVSGIALWFYQATQSRIHVIVTHGFLRSLARLDLAESRVRRFPAQSVDDLPDPEREADRVSRYQRPVGVPDPRRSGAARADAGS